MSPHSWLEILHVSLFLYIAYRSKEHFWTTKFSHSQVVILAICLKNIAAVRLNWTGIRLQLNMQWPLLQIEREMSFLLAVFRSSKKSIEGRVERLGLLWTHVVLTAAVTTAMLSSQTSQTWPPLTNVKAGACFSNVAKLFGWHKSLCVFNTKTFQALNLAVI